MKKTATRTTIIIICLVAALVGYYAYLSNKNKESQDEATMTLVQSTLSRDLVSDYPATPKEVMKYYHEIMKCFYDEETTEKEIDQLALKARELYDRDLLAENPESVYLASLRSEISDFKDKKRKISSFSVPGSTSVVTDTIDGYSFARIVCSFNVTEGGFTTRIRTAYLLRRDENKRWKIYGWLPAGDLDTGAEDGV